MCVAALFCSEIFSHRPRAQQIGHAPIEVLLLRPPTPTVALGRTHLVYELHLTNFGSSAARLDQLEVLDGERTVLAGWSGRQLWQRIRVVRPLDAAAATTDALEPGLHGIGGRGSGVRLADDTVPLPLLAPGPRRQHGAVARADLELIEPGGRRSEVGEMQLVDEMGSAQGHRRRRRPQQLHFDRRVADLLGPRPVAEDPE
jgi:hypothetical protein